jgi:SAM-dependent methyltransferase
MSDLPDRMSALQSDGGDTHAAATAPSAVQFHPSWPAQARETRNRVQREYFDTIERSRGLPVDTPYVRRHVDETLADGRFGRGAALLEIGAGLGKGTLPLLARGFDVTATDLSPVLLGRLQAAAPQPIRTIACDVVDLAKHVDRRFDGAVGFFVLHHLVGFDDIFRALAGVLKPGARVAFCEPVAWNPLYYLQIVLTPSMSLAGEISLTAMRPDVILPAMERAGFVEAASRRFGYFPPVVTNVRSGQRLERWLERQAWFPFPHAFQVFSGRTRS